MPWYYLLVTTSTALFCIGIIKFLKRPFYNLALVAVRQLNVILDKRLDEREKDKLILRNLSKLLYYFFLTLIILLLLICASALPVYFYLNLEEISKPDLSSWKFYLCMIIGSGVLFLFGKGKSDYSYWSKLLHTIVLDNYSIGQFFFRRETKKLKETNANKDYYIITGLARAGTTALTNLLFEESTFHSIRYSNMPFLMAPKWWRKYYSPKESKEKERAHGDKVKFGESSIEALEEYFFKVMLNDEYIHEDRLSLHLIDDDIYAKYRSYQSLFETKGHTKYLAKNNNFILRYSAIRALDPNFKVAIIFRSPLEHANSLLRQHENFLRLQVEDPFVLDYMTWLGHYEFGKNQKVFDFGHSKSWENFEKSSPNYWLAIWINYYSYVLSLPKDENMVLIDYQDLLSNPNQLLQKLSQQWQFHLPDKNVNEFTPKPYDTKSTSDSELAAKANEIYTRLMEQKFRMT